MKYMVIRRTRYGWEISDDISGNKCHYIGYSKRSAIRKHRVDNGVVGKHFTLIDMGD